MESLVMILPGVSTAEITKKGKPTAMNGVGLGPVVQYANLYANLIIGNKII